MENGTKLGLDQLRILDLCAQIESVGAQIYWHFAASYGEQPELSRLWEKTAREEENHARQFQLASRLHGEGISSLKSDCSRALSVLDKVRSALESVRKCLPSPAEALRFCIRMEHALREFHMGEVTVFQDQRVARLFEAMMKVDQDHIVMLERSYKAWFGESPGESPSGTGR